MTDTHQAIYHAVRSRLSNCDVGAAVESAILSAGLAHYADRAAMAVEIATYEYTRPSAVYRPSLFIDGNMWCALYGDNLQDGVAGFGDTPSKAMIAFDSAWLNAKTPIAKKEKRECA